MSMFRQRSNTPSTSAPANMTHSDSGQSAASATASHPEVAFPAAPSQSKPKFGFSEIANMFVRLRRHQSRASLASMARRQEQEGAPAPESEPAIAESPAQERVPLPTSHIHDDSGRLVLTPPAIPSRNRVRRLTGGSVPYARQRSTSGTKKPKAHHIVSSSGPTPITQTFVRDSLLEGGSKIPVTYTDRFEVVNGVNTPTLLRATRRTILETIEGMQLGVNALADEQWECTICGPKNKIYRVEISYSATAVRCTRPDGFRPVALDRAKSIPGLMTITKRNDQ